MDGMIKVHRKAQLAELLAELSWLAGESAWSARRDWLRWTSRRSREAVMPEEPMPGPLGTEAREVSFPDGSHGVILVKAGLSQGEADLLAARVWAELPKG